MVYRVEYWNNNCGNYRFTKEFNNLHEAENEYQRVSKLRFYSQLFKISL